MKYLDYPLLVNLSESLSSNPSPELRVHVRLEAYSVKPIRGERKMFKEMEEAYVSGQEEMEEMSFSPEMREAGLSSCFGRLDEKESRKVHFLLVSTLNSAFPDHDFSSLRPEHFTREPSSAVVLGHLSGSLLSPSGTGAGIPPIIAGQAGAAPHLSGSLSSPPSYPYPATTAFGSPISPQIKITDPELYRVLNEVVALEECDCYSFFPQPEYDPHIAADEYEDSEEGVDFGDDEVLEEENYRMDVDDESELPASWGAGGLELDDVPVSAPMARSGSSSGGKKSKNSDDAGTKPKLSAERLMDEWEASRDRRAGGLLWSANYFFYSKRQKRVLFLTCWCRKRSMQLPSPPEETSSFPLPISASYAPGSSAPGPTQLPQLRAHRLRPTHNTSNARSGRKRSKINLKAGTTGDLSATIPIRGLETPKASRLATSAPSAFGSIHHHATTPSSVAAAVGRMNVGNFKPKQTPARVAMNAKTSRPVASASDDLHFVRTAPRVLDADGKDKETKVRKDRNESTTPGPPKSMMGLVDHVMGGKETKA